MIASPGWTPGPTTTWSSRSRWPSCGLACGPCCAATRPAPNGSAIPIWSSIWLRPGSPAASARWSSPAPSTCSSSCSCATRAGCSATRRSSRPCGATTSARAPGTCGCTWATCAPSWKRAANPASCTPCAGSATSCGTRGDPAEPGVSGGGGRGADRRRRGQQRAVSLLRREPAGPGRRQPGRRRPAGLRHRPNREEVGRHRSVPVRPQPSGDRRQRERPALPGRGGRPADPVRAPRRPRCGSGQPGGARVLRRRAPRRPAVPDLHRRDPARGRAGAGQPGGGCRRRRAPARLLPGLTAAATGVPYGAARLPSGRVLRPIAELTAAAEHVTETRDLTARLGSTGTSDEVGRLASSFDTMLSALDESLTAQRQLVADASHELRTPLTSLTTNLDLLEDGAGLADPQAPTLVRAAREQAGELDQLITDLLDLARYREAAPHRETVRLDLLTSEAVERLRQRLPQTVIRADLRPCLVLVDPAAVEHAVSNLVDNAVKWTPPGAVVRVTVAGGQVSVADHGPGIAADDLPRIF